MGIIVKPFATTDGTSAVGANVSSNWDTIYAEFNGNIDNNNIKNNAGIVDSKLATISTAGKVSTTAITGTFTNVSYVSITATSILGTNVATTTFTATTITATTVSASNFNGVTYLGTWSNALLSGTNYQATTDGFVRFSKSTAGQGALISDGTVSPTTTAGAFYTDGTNLFTGAYPVRKNDYWRVPDGINIIFLPLGR